MLTRNLTRRITQALTRKPTEPGNGGAASFDPASLFASGQKGAWYDHSDFSTLFQDSAGTTPVTAVGQPVGKILDKSGRGNHAAASGTLRQDGNGFYYLETNGTSDGLTVSGIALTEAMDVLISAWRDPADGDALLAYGDTTHFIGVISSGSSASTVNLSGQIHYRVNGTIVTGGIAPTRGDLHTAFAYSAPTVIEAVDADLSAWGSNFKVGNYTGFGFKGRIYSVFVRELMTDTERLNMRNYMAENCGASVIDAPASGGSDIVYFNNYGQSLAEGSDGAITTSQEYTNIGFAARAIDPTATATLTVANTQYASRGESPMYGALAMIQQLIAAEGGPTLQLLACNNGVSSQTIAALSKDTGSIYAMVPTQARSGYGIAKAQNRNFRAGATFWTQGESGDALLYKENLITLATDLDADFRVRTGQTSDSILITYQTADPAIGLQQLAAHDESALIYMATPCYPFPRYDSLHVTAAGSQHMGAYYGLVWKRVVIDGVAWEPLRPIAFNLNGAILDITFNNTAALVFDGSTFAAQTNQGFTLTDAAESGAVTISSVALLNSATVRITAAEPIIAGTRLFYAASATTGRGDFVGGSGNLRDSAGDTLTFKGNPMHNWCVQFKQIL